MNYEVMNMTYSPIRLILSDNSEVIIESRISENNTIFVEVITDQIKALSEKNFVKVRTMK